jgi:glycogen synthase
VSVVISTLNRGPLLRKSLQSLKYQNYGNFEVVVVNGPSTDDSESVIASYGKDLVVRRIEEANLSKSRNEGIKASSGDYVLFLDDDAFAEPDWIANIVSGYSDPTVGGVGTRVYDFTGFRWQMNPFLIDQFYKPNFAWKPPLWAFHFKDSTTIPHILGASSSFRRDALIDIGGFDEEIEYFLDESEVCRRISELGLTIKFIDSGASVHHKFASGVTRDDRKILTYPYPVVKNKYYVALSDWKRCGGDLAKVVRECDEWTQELLDGARWQFDNQGISRNEYDRFVKDVRRGQAHGRLRAATQERKSAVIGPAKPDALVPFATISAVGGRRTFCFISRWLPRRSPGGIARYMWDLATGFARHGHEVHIITMVDTPSMVEFEDGVWIRGLSQAEIEQREVPPIVSDAFGEAKSGAARMNIAWSRAAHAEVLRLRRDRYVDAVVAPIWDQEGVFCALDDTLFTVVSTNTSFRTFAEIEWRNLDRDTLRELTLLENVYIEKAKAFHCNSRASEQSLEQVFGRQRDGNWFRVPHGVADISPIQVKRAADNRVSNKGAVNILYVSRLEQRKGADLLLLAVAALLQNGEKIKVHVVGRDSYAGDPSRSCKDQFLAAHPALTEAVVFHGELDDASLVSLYETADIFCVPSRYESFGIIYIEAMRYGLPVVALAAGGVTDIVVDGETGLLCNDKTAFAVQSALQTLLSDRKLRQRMGQAGRERFTHQFEDDVVVQHMLRELRAVLDQRETACRSREN